FRVTVHCMLLITVPVAEPDAFEPVAGLNVAWQVWPMIPAQAASAPVCVVGIVTVTVPPSRGKAPRTEALHAMWPVEPGRHTMVRVPAGAPFASTTGIWKGATSRVVPTWLVPLPRPCTVKPLPVLVNSRQSIGPPGHGPDSMGPTTWVVPDASC